MSKTISEMQVAVHKLAVEKGWHERPMRDADGKINVDAVGAKLMLVVSEIAEALEELRNDPVDLGLSEDRALKCEKPEGFDIELADAIIRIMDLSEALDLDVGAAIDVKHAYNATRPHRHGGKSL